MEKLTVLILILLCAVPVMGGGEIRAFSGASTCWACVREADGDVWYISGQTFETWGTGGRTAADYDIALTDKSGDMFVGDMDTNITAGYYYIVTHQQVGGAAADTDPAVYEQYGYWDATNWDVDIDTLQDVVADTNELQEDWADGGRLDAIVDAIKAVTDVHLAVSTTVASPNDANNFTITAGKDANDVYEGMFITVQDVDDSHYETRMIDTYESGRDVEVDTAFSFTPAAADPVYIWNVAYFVLEIYDAIPIPDGPAMILIDERD